MSVNDDLPWIGPALRLICEARTRSIPVLGHCLGGQLIAKALGADVRLHPEKEIGWFPVRARTPFGTLPTEFEAFHWHGESFTLPSGAAHLFENDNSRYQGFVAGNCLALQFHIEMLPGMVETWAEQYADEIATASATVQDLEELTRDLGRRLQRLHEIADVIYDEWIRGLT